MLRKLILLAISVLFLAGCGVSEPPEETTACIVPETTADSRVEEGSGETAGEPTDPLGAPAVDHGEQPEYFVFTTSSNTVTNDDGVAVLYENRTNVQFISGDEERSTWVHGILDQIAANFDTNSTNLSTYAWDYLLEAGTDGFYSFSNYQQLGTARHDETVVSLVEISSLYSGGSHPNSVQIAYNMDIANQRLLRLEDVIAEGTESDLARMVQEGVDAKFAVIDGMNGLFDDYADTIAGSFTYGCMTPYWYFNDAGLVIFYNQYELGPYAAGTIKVELGYTDLEGILQPQFIPADQAEPGSVKVLSSGENLQSISVEIEPEGKTLCIGVEGVIHEVQISEVLWLDDTAIGQNVRFSAESLATGDVLQITGGFDDETRSFAIKFRNEDGIQVLYLHDGALTGTP